MNDELRERLQRMEDLLLKLLDVLAGDEDEDDPPGPFGAERNQDEPL